MQVLHVIPAVAPRYGGPSSAIGPLCRALAQAGADARILATNADGSDFLSVTLGEWTTWQGVPAMFFRKDFSEAYKYSRGLAGWIRTHARDFDVVHVHGVLSHAPLAAAAACRAAGVPYVVRPLGTVAQWSLDRKAWRKRVLMAWSGRTMLRGAAAIHCTSEDERADAERTLGLKQSIVIPLGIDDALLSAPFSEEGRSSDRYVLALSRLHAKKNLDTLIDAFADVAQGPLANWRLVIAGEGDHHYLRLLQARARVRSVAERVQFMGWVEGVTKHDLLLRASLFASPSLHENFGVAVADALAAGVPVLISRAVPLAADVEHAGAGWVVGTDRLSIGKGLEVAAGETTNGQTRASAARNLARRFTWANVAAALLALYERIHT